jgi:anti-sigma factor RsiW
MSHQPFESHLLDDELLTDEQQNALAQHLKECERCFAYSLALTELDTVLHHSPSPLPAPGFTQRWQARLAKHQQARQNRKYWLMASSLLVLASLTMLTMFMINFSQINWSYELTQTIARISVFAAQIRQLVKLSRTFVSTLPVLVPIIALAAYGTVIAVCALIFTWFKTIIKLYSPIHERENLS